MKRYLIVVAGGSGERLGGEIPKQFLEIEGKPILAHTVGRFIQLESPLEIFLVLPEHHKTLWKEYCKESNFIFKHRLVSGGVTRFHSVKNALDLIEEPGVVAIHDGVRPFISQPFIERLFKAAESSDAVIPITPLYDSLRRRGRNSKGEKVWSPVDRDSFRLVQTPQIFSTQLIKEAYSQPYSPSFTDDASVVESMGAPISFIEGERLNFKITERDDLKMAEALFKIF